jgi:hypothetical protein
MHELGLHDLASADTSVDGDNTWQQALSSGLVDTSMAASS